MRIFKAIRLTVLSIQLRLLILVVLQVIVSCNWQTPHPEEEKIQYTAWMKLATAYSNTQPDSCLHYTDSLSRMAYVKSHDSLLVPVVINRILAWRQQGKLDSCLLHLPGSRNLCKRIKDTANWSRAENITASVLISKGHSRLAIQHASRALEIARSGRLPLHEAKAYSSLAEACIDNNEFANAQLYLNKAYVIYSTLDSLPHLSGVAATISYNYKQLGNMDSAFYYGEQAIQFAEACPGYIYRILPYSNMGILYQETKPDLALNWYDKAIEISPNRPEPRFSKVNVYIGKQQYDTAIQLLRMLTVEAQQSGSLAGLARCYWQSGRIYLARGQSPEAIEDLTKAIHIGDSIGTAYISIGARETMKSVFSAAGRMQEAFQLSEGIARLNDSILQSQNSTAMEAIQIYHDAERKQQKVNQAEQEIAWQLRINKQLVMLLSILTFALLALAFAIQRARKYHRKMGQAYDRLIGQYRAETAALHEQLQKLKPQPLFDRLLELMEKEKPWLNHQLTVDDIAEKLQTSSRHLSAELKLQGLPSVTRLVQQYRVNCFMENLQNPAFSNYKLEAISKASGFRSYRTFFLVFEQVTGLTPEQYRKRIAKSESAK